jgi:putative redox protein
MKPNYFKAALAADALSLGPHWIYNQGKLARLYPDGIIGFTDPASSYHPNRKAGQLTHFGDQMVLLKDSLEPGDYDESRWRETWLAGMADYDGYLDGATKETLASKGLSPSFSNDLSGASRLAPILDLDLSSEAKIAAARSQTAMTHGDPGVEESAEFFVRATLAIEGGATFAEAFEKAASEGNYPTLNPGDALKCVATAGEDYLKVGSEYGLTCHLPEAFPLTLYLALRDGGTFQSAISENGLAGGDTSARAMLLALLFEARDPGSASSCAPEATPPHPSSSPHPKITTGSNSLTIEGPYGPLSAVLEMPEGEPDAFALFAHCFTCGKDFVPGVRLSKELATQDIATLRIDFSGLGQSGGAFEDSSFLTNVDDLLAAADWMNKNLTAPTLLIGHSLGGAATLSAASRLDSTKAVVTIGAPFEPDHVTHLFESHLEEIEQKGKADVKLAGRNFVIGKRFLTDFEKHCHDCDLASFSGISSLIIHAPEDAVVPLANAGKIYSALPHPKSFISLAGADHLLTKAEDARYVANLIGLWAKRAIV